MKKVFVLVQMFLVLTSLVFPQEPAVQITYPTNGSVITLPDGISSITVTISCTYSGILGTTERWELFDDPYSGFSTIKYPYNIPGVNNVVAGIYTWRLERGYFDVDGKYIKMGDSQVSFSVRASVTAKNSFNAGTIEVNYVTQNSGYKFWPEPSSTFQLKAIDQYYSDYQRQFNIWSSGNPSREIFPQATSSTNITYTANFLRVLNATLQNSLAENGGNAGYIYADGTRYSVSKVVSKTEGSSTTIAADNNQPVTNGIISIFDHWWDGNTSSSRTITPSDNTTYTAYYKGKPSTSSRSLSISTTVDQPVRLSWNEHPSTNVTQYQIYRKVKPSGGSVGPETLIATVNRGTLSYTDNQYVVSNLYYYQLFYDVRPYYQPSGLTSDPAYVSTFGDINMGHVDNKVVQQKQMKEIPDGYAVVNYPNPFNPTTVINYQLPKDGMVTLKVYDVLGKEIATLVNDNRTAGYYSVEFNASNLPSGIYIYTITTNNYTQSKKMLLMK